ncbi:MAG: LPS export ABC transporter permease LptF [Gammaproteobacteria bacterium]|jgi:lipopolysaccharide export system permease protein|nr:LPS export ABC transporter permease LptF [Gammaproteobacteria bacterium]
MVILQRYILRQGLLASLLSLVVFLGVVSALFLAELLGEAAQGELPGGSVLLMLGLRLPEAIMLVGPLALLTGLLMTLGRLQEESELVVMRSGGLAYRRLLRPVLAVAVLWAGGLLLVSGWLSPLAIERSATLLADAARNAMVAGLRPGQFDRLNHGRTTVYVGGIDRRSDELSDLFIQHMEDGETQVLTANRGRLWLPGEDEGRYLLLSDGYQVHHPSDPQTGGVREMRFARNELRLPAPEEASVESEAGFLLPELLPAATPAQRREWHWRLAAPLAGLLLGMLALPLASRRPRQGRHASVVAALVLYLVYSNAVHGGLILMERHEAMRGPGLWPVHGALALLVGALLWRHWRSW